MMKHIPFLVISAFLIAVSAHAAPIQWTGNGHSYDVYLLDPVLTWEDARDAAEEKGGYLATITSADENEFVWDLVSDKDNFSSYWLGGYQTDGNDEPKGNWAWVSGEEWDYTNWAPGEPDDNTVGGNKQNYLHFWPNDGLWDDMENGRYMAGYVVEFEPVPEPGTFVLFGFGIAGLVGMRKRFKK